MTDLEKIIDFDRICRDLIQILIADGTSKTEAVKIVVGGEEL